MKDKDTITVYWGPTPSETVESWSMLYAPPVHVLNTLRKHRSPEVTSSNMFVCPAVTGAFKNLYALESTIDNEFTFPPNIDDVPLLTYMEHEGKLAIMKPRVSALSTHRDIDVNMSWTFFADEPLVARFTAPYYPPTTPGPGVMLSAGEFDIGSWFRPFRLNYFVPYGVNTLKFKTNDPLVFVEFKTEKKIVFKRYQGTPLLASLARECAESPQRYGLFKSLAERYEMAKRTKLTNQVLQELEKNVID